MPGAAGRWQTGGGGCRTGPVAARKRRAWRWARAAAPFALAPFWADCQLGRRGLIGGLLVQVSGPRAPRETGGDGARAGVCRPPRWRLGVPLGVLGAPCGG